MRKVGRQGGWIIQCRGDTAIAEGCFELPAPDPSDRWVACFRCDSCWMVPTVGSRIADVPDETQMLLLEKEGTYTVYVPLVKEGFRASLLARNGKLQVRVESGSPAVMAVEFDAVYLNRSTDPYGLMHAAAQDLHDELGTFHLPAHRPRPTFMDFYGWCSWNAFYMEVSAEKIERVLQTFDEQGLCPGFVVIDGGWQSSTQWHLTGLGCDPAKFPQGLEPAIRQLKARYGVGHVFLWQTYNGFWCGLDPAVFPDACRADMEPPQRLLSSHREGGAEAGAVFDTNSKNFYPEHALAQAFWHPASYEAFYDEYHRRMSEAGADGAKIDAITWIETCGKDRGGRVAMMKEFLRAAERSIERYFNGEAIWCSSCSNDFLLNSKGGGVVRTSMDFFPKRPETHGMHIYANAINSLFMGAFIHPDWDMFQSALGAPSDFHAAARAISGGPVYSTDAFGEENFGIIRRLALPGGTVPLCAGIALPAAESIFADPQAALLKLYNRNRCGHVLGIFNCAYEAGGDALRSGMVSVADVYPLRDSTSVYAVYGHNGRSLQLATTRNRWRLALGTFGFELFTVVEVRNGFAPLGDPGLYNTGGVVLDWRTEADVHRVELMPCRRFAAYSVRRPAAVSFNGKPVAFDWEHTLLSLDLDAPAQGEMVIDLGGSDDK